MLPFNLGAPAKRPVLAGAGAVFAPVLPPVVRNFDPTVERLSFTLDQSDAQNPLVLRDLRSGNGVRVQIGERLLVTLMGCAARDIPEDCLSFDFVD